MRHKGIATLIALFAAGVLAESASAVTVNPVIDWTGPLSAAYEPGFVAPFTSNAGNVLTIVGKITLAFNSPLNGYNVAGPNEYTFVFTGMTSTGTTDAGSAWKVNYNNGTWAIYEDATPDAAFGTNPPNATSPSTYNDGTIILSGTFSNFYTLSNKSNPGGNYNADVFVTGGSAYALLGNDRCGQLIGVWNRTGAPTGYIRTADGKIDLGPCPVPVEPSTWSRVKGLLLAD